jgi:hypothetical protein
MSHFLERLAAGVTQPASQARLKPLLGSVFAPTPQIGQGDAVPIESSTFSFLRPAPVRSEQARTLHPSLRSEEDFRARKQDEHQESPSLHAQDQPASLPPVSSHIEPEKPVFRPLIANVQSATPFENPLTSPGAAPNPVEDERAQHASPGFASPQPLNQAEAPGPYRPLVRIEQPQTAASNPHLLPPQTEARAARNPSAETSSRSTSPSQEPDEIHIHIGRIEVAAIAQPAPRPTAPPARKSLDLGEYLKRGNGRAR